MSWGGKREGAGRKPKKGEVRKNCTLKATAEEWKIILAFAKILKHGDAEKAKQLVMSNEE